MLLLLALSRAAAQEHSSAPAVLHLRGSVVNALTEKPIARALVTSSDDRVATLTDGNGHFAIDLSLTPQGQQNGVASLGLNGGITLSARKPGFVPQPLGVTVSLHAGSAPADVSLPLLPTASLHGRILTESLDGAANAQVMLLKRIVEEGEHSWRVIASQPASQSGGFRFAELPPGEYSLLTAEWTGSEPPLARAGTISMGYPPLFAGEAKSLGAATKFHLHWGDALTDDLHLHRTQYFPISLPLVGVPEGAAVSLSFRDEFDSFSLGYNARTSTAEGSLPEGSYDLLVSSYGRASAFGELRLHVSAAASHLQPLALVPVPRIAVHVTTQFSHPQPQGAASAPAIVPPGGGDGQPAPPLVQLLVSTTSGNGRMIFAASVQGVDGELGVDNVAPGSYQVEPRPARGYVASMTAGGLDLFTHPLVIQAGGRPQAIEVVLRDDTAIVRGTVGAGTPAARQEDVQPGPVFLLPLDASARFLQGYHGSDGRFEIENVAPGTYRVISLGDPAAQIAYREPKALHAFDSLGPSITVTAGQTIDVEVPRINAGAQADEEGDLPAEETGEP